MAHDYEKLIKCPYCDHEWEDSWEFGEDEGEHICGACEREFNVIRNIEVTYCTTKKDCETHEYKQGSPSISKMDYLGNGKWTDLPEEKWKHYRVDECKNCDHKHYVKLTPPTKQPN